MATIIPLPNRGVLLVFLTGAFGCASGDLVLPDPPGGGENVALSKFGGDNGDNQEGIVGEQLPKPFVVQVLTARAQPAVGWRVAFVPTSPADPATADTAITNSQGLATAQPILGTSPGDYVFEARLVAGDEIQTEQFRVAAKPAPPDTLSPLSPVSQPGRRGQHASTPPRVRVVDRFGNPVPEVLVAWQVTAGEGQTSAPITRTGSDGTTTVDWTLGNRIGVHKLTATIERATGSPATFTVTVFF